ncbi:conserved Plasmodium protein, unknown function [Plasmodium gallinaceum]|uniref:RRM domain-containing protein n=1 Tax=Plasmodium gallinaceum TaxID=5849 RepID=A0A1J1GQ56_PLAGA|nr:conserved Plasmodium protein, unknown function [Plasmodium gallinaceum]CRG94436.1 conserved Plasmodium protein, unknown function [Plasmodium gallinaceum]
MNFNLKIEDKEFLWENYNYEENILFILFLQIIYYYPINIICNIIKHDKNFLLYFLLYIENNLSRRNIDIKELDTLILLTKEYLKNDKFDESKKNTLEALINIWNKHINLKNKNYKFLDDNNDDAFDYDDEEEEDANNNFRENVEDKINDSCNNDYLLNKENNDKILIKNSETTEEITEKKNDFNEKKDKNDDDKKDDNSENYDSCLNENEINEKIENILNNLSSDEEEGEVVEDEIPYERVKENNEENKEIILLNIYSEISDKNLNLLLSIFGKIKNICMDDNERIHVLFFNINSAKKAKNYLDNLKIKNRRMQVIYGDYQENKKDNEDILGKEENENNNISEENKKDISKNFFEKSGNNINLKKNVKLYKNKKYYMKNSQLFHNNNTIFKNTPKNNLHVNNFFSSFNSQNLPNDFILSSEVPLNSEKIINNHEHSVNIEKQNFNSINFIHPPPPPPPINPYNSFNENIRKNNVESFYVLNNFSINNEKNIHKISAPPKRNINDQFSNNFISHKYNNYEISTNTNYISYLNTSFSKNVYSKNIPPPPHTNNIGDSNKNASTPKLENYTNIYQQKEMDELSSRKMTDIVSINDANPFNIHKDNFMINNPTWINRKENKVLKWCTNASIEENHLDFLNSFFQYKLFNRYLLVTNIPTNLQDLKKFKEYINNLFSKEKKNSLCVEVFFFSSIKNEEEKLFRNENYKKGNTEDNNNNNNNENCDDVNDNTSNNYQNNDINVNNEESIYENHPNNEGQSTKDEHINEENMNNEKNNTIENEEINKNDERKMIEKVEEEEKEGEDKEEIRKDNDEYKDDISKNKEKEDEKKDSKENYNIENNSKENEKCDYMNDISNNVTEKNIKNETEKKKKKIYAHLTFRTIKKCVEAKKALEEKNFLVTFSAPLKPNNCLWIGNILKNYFFNTASVLKTMFTHFGEITNIKYVSDKNCFFLQYKNVHNAIKARNHLYGVQISNNTLLNIDFSTLGEWESKQKVNLSRRKLLDILSNDNNKAQEKLEKKLNKRNTGFLDSKIMLLLKKNSHKKNFNNKYDTDNPQKISRDNSTIVIDKKKNRTKKNKSHQNNSEYMKNNYHNYDKRDSRKTSKRKCEQTDYRDHKKKKDLNTNPKNDYSNEDNNNSNNNIDNDNAKEKTIAFYVNQKYKCDFSAKFYKGNPSIKIYPKLNVETKSDIKNLKQIKSSCSNYSIWQLGATANQKKKFVRICEHFSKKKNIPVIIDKQYTTFIVPIKEDYLRDLEIENTDYMYAFVLETKKS